MFINNSIKIYGRQPVALFLTPSGIPRLKIQCPGDGHGWARRESQVSNVFISKNKLLPSGAPASEWYSLKGEGEFATGILRNPDKPR
jgi:hypothetical protein